MPSPLILLITSATLIGGMATIIVVISVAVDGWQEVLFNEQELAFINTTSTHITLYSVSSNPQFYKVIDSSRTEPGSGLNATVYWLHSSVSGLWRTCDQLTDNERELEKDTIVPNYRCFIFVTDYDEDSPLLTDKAKQISRLHNSAASCYIVVLIDLSSAAVVGLIGILKKQVASCMVTGVLYCMAALFGIFGLAMFHTKHYYERYECYALDYLPRDLCPARDVALQYGVSLAWVGVALCSFASMLWLIFARALRVIMAKTML